MAKILCWKCKKVLGQTSAKIDDATYCCKDCPLPEETTEALEAKKAVLEEELVKVETLLTQVRAELTK